MITLLSCLKKHLALKNLETKCWPFVWSMVICLERGADCFHMVHLMPLLSHTPSFLAPHYNPEQFYVSGIGLPRLSWKGAINGCLLVLACQWLLYAAKVYQGLREADKAVWDAAEIWWQPGIPAAASAPHLWRDGQLPRHLVHQPGGGRGENSTSCEWHCWHEAARI